MKQILLILSDGRLAYSRPCAPLLPEETEAEYLERVSARLLETFPGAEVKGYVEDDVIPSDATRWKYRDAWKFDNGVIKVDVDRAKEIAMDALRRERNAKLQALDVDEMRYATDAKRLAEVRASKVDLRDAPVEWSGKIDKAKTVEELEAVKLPGRQSQIRTQAGEP
jgi:hypothetical protein